VVYLQYHGKLNSAQVQPVPFCGSPYLPCRCGYLQPAQINPPHAGL